MLGRCAPQFVVESNGDVYPCDFYVLDQYRCGNVQTDSLEDMATCDAVKTFLAEPRRDCSQCATCPFERICHKNCKRFERCLLPPRRYCRLPRLLGIRRACDAADRPLAITSAYLRERQPATSPASVMVPAATVSGLRR